MRHGSLVARYRRSFRVIGRRAFVGGALGGLISSSARGTLTAAAQDGNLSAWSPGTLDIHHIDTGRGNATFVIGPDGTTMLIDCGTSNSALDVTSPPRPNASRLPGEWVARYALRHAIAARRHTLDYLIATHVHPDHVGDVLPSERPLRDGFVPTGLSQVDQFMPATVVIDRSYPDYGALPPPEAPYTSNYIAWLAARKRHGRSVEALRVGSNRQIQLRSPGRYPSFSVRAIAANGRVWTGKGEASRDLFPPPAALSAAQRPPENCCSIALRIAYGRFSYFTGGDLNFDTNDGLRPWMDVETPAVHAAGRVEVAVADHHGYFDSCGPEFTRVLDAQAYVIPSWHVTHPGQVQLERLLGGRPGEPSHDVFALEMLALNRTFNARFVNRLKSTQGHVVVRVAPDGESYRIYVIDSLVEVEARATSFGPYRCRGAVA